MRSWRKEAVKSAGGTSWRLVTGRADERMTLNLSRVTEDEAETARLRMNLAEQSDEADRVIRTFAKDIEAGRRYLLADPDAAEVAGLAPVGPDYAKMTLRAYFDTVYAPARSVASGSWRSEASSWKRLLGRDGLGDVPLKRLTDARTFGRWSEALRVQPRGGNRRGRGPTPAATEPASVAYRRLLRAALASLLKHAWREEHLEELADLGTIEIRSRTARAPAPEPLTLDEVKRLLDAADPRHRALFGVGVGVGLRPSELVRIDWSDVDWTTRVLAVRGTKTEAARDRIPLTPIAFRELRAWWIASGQPTEGLAFTTARGAPYRTVGSPGYKGALERTAKAAGIERPVNPYLLRHSFATIAWTLGVDKDTARRILRHTDEAMLDRVYTHPRPADLVKRVAAFDLAAG